MASSDLMFRCIEHAVFMHLSLLFIKQTSLWTRTKRMLVSQDMIEWDFLHATHSDGQMCVYARVQIHNCIYISESLTMTDCTKRRGRSMKTNLRQPWPKLCKIIKKKSFADRGRDEKSLSLVHYRSRLTGEHIWITHRALIKQLAASTTGSGEEVNTCQRECLCTRFHVRFHVHLVYS